MCKLSSLKNGQSGVVKSLGSKGALRRRMIDMGITPGTQVTMVKLAPMGDPMQINVHGYDLSIRKSEAEQINIYTNVQNEEYMFNSVQDLNLSSQNVNVPLVDNNLSLDRPFTAALIGNPNSGKTTLFNALTGSYQYVGNWPGVTVSRKEGVIKNVEETINLVDLPGVYSLSPYSPEEVVTRNYILDETPDVIINILDATNLERNLYLTTQLLELDFPMIVVLNMTDLLHHKGQIIDYKFLENKLGVPVIPVSAGKGTGVADVITKLEEFLHHMPNSRRVGNIYSIEVKNALQKIDDLISGTNGNSHILHQRFKTVKVFEDDPLVITDLKIDFKSAKFIESIRDSVSKLYGKDKDIIIADERYKYISLLCQKAVKNIQKPHKMSFSNVIDFIITGKYTAMVCFLFFIFLIFYITFGPFGVMLKSLCESFINNSMKISVERILNYFGASPWSKSLVLDAVIGGVGAVLSFLPQVILLFALISVLEDCGYMARAAFIMDKPFRKIGLSGKAFVPLIMGFGCTVPAVMGTKILESKKDRLLTVFLIPFMSCSAKMPIYLLFASAFFPAYQTLAIFSIYILGVILAVFTAYLLKDNVFKGEDSPFIMEMPEYKVPSLKNVWMSVWDRTKDFVERAGTVILVATVIVWFLQSFNLQFRYTQDNSQSLLAAIGGIISPLFKFCGFGDWRACVALLTGLMAKESIVSTLSVLYSIGDTSNFAAILQRAFSLPSAMAFMVFSLLYTPCIAALSAICREFDNKKLSAIFIVYQFLLAYVCASLVYQLSSLLIKIF